MRPPLDHDNGYDAGPHDSRRRPDLLLRAEKDVGPRAPFRRLDRQSSSATSTRLIPGHPRR